MGQGLDTDGNAEWREGDGEAVENGGEDGMGSMQEGISSISMAWSPLIWCHGQMLCPEQQESWSCLPCLVWELRGSARALQQLEGCC